MEDITTDDLDSLRLMFEEYVLADDINSIGMTSAETVTTASIDFPASLLGLKRERPLDLLTDAEFKSSIRSFMGESSVESNPVADPARLNHLMRFPERLQLAVNAGNFDLPRRLFADACVSNVEITAPVGPKIEGITDAVAFLSNLYMSMPDLVIVCKPSKRYHRVLFSKLYADGTLLGGPFAAYNPFTTGKVDPLIPAATYEKYRQLESEGRPVLMRSKNYLHMILNREMTHIEKIIVANRSRELVDLSASFGTHLNEC